MTTSAGLAVRVSASLYFFFSEFSALLSLTRNLPMSEPNGRSNAMTVDTAATATTNATMPHASRF